MILEDGDVHVWYARTESLPSPTALHDCQLLLPRVERDRWRRFGTWPGRREYLLTRELVRTTLSRYAPVDPRVWRFRASPNGRPEIDAPEREVPLRFNVSHTQGLVLCAVARGREVGVDVETWDRPRAVRGLAARFFSVEEAAAVHAGSAGDAAALFVRLWTLKEAYVKARGLTLSAALRHVVFDVGADGTVHAGFAPSAGDDPATWHFALLAPTPRHCVAVAARRRPEERPLAIALRNATIGAGHGEHDPDRR